MAFSPTPAFAGAWTENEGQGQLIATLFGWFGDGSPWGGNPAVKQNRIEAQAYLQYGITNELTIFGQTALERYALSRPEESLYTGFDYSELGIRQKLWSTGEWVFSGEATLFIPGAHNSASPAQAGNTGGAAEGRLLAGYNLTVGPWPAFLDFEGAYRFRSAGPPNEWHADATLGVKFTPRLMVMLQDFTTISTAQVNPGFPSWRNSVVEASVVIGLDDRWSLQLGLFTTIVAIRTNTQHGAALAVWRNF